MPTKQTIQIRSSARLHFGLWAWGDSYERQFGGVGMMLKHPVVVVRCTQYSGFCATGAAAARIRRVVEQCARTWRLHKLPDCQIEAIELPPRHTGFGVGTQLALAVARAVAAWIGLDPASATDLGVAAGRGGRSAVGTHGFMHGGLIVDAGKRADETVGKLHCRNLFPDEWRVVCVTPNGDRGKSGEAEKAAFARLAPVPLDVANQLQSLALNHMVPACEACEFDRFAAAVFEYGHLAGRCFASVQGGPYASEQVSDVVQGLRRLGAVGVGQSSWGPTVFAMMPSVASANALAAAYRASVDASNMDIIITAARNRGATVAYR